MDIKKLDRQQSFIKMEEWKKANDKLPDLDMEEYRTIRKDITNFVESMTVCPTEDKYKFDEDLALFVYDYFNNKSWFTERLAANDDFWCYITLMVLPNIVKMRWYYSEDYYWKVSTRIYFSRLWWYVHLSKQNTAEETKIVLDSPNCSEDTILNLVERTGQDGTYIDVYRLIMKFYSKIPYKKLSELNKKYKSETGKQAETLFRVIMKMNTAKVMVMELSLCLGGEEGYVLSLFKEIGLNF